MAYTGATGKTRLEIARVLGFSNDQDHLAAAETAKQIQLEEEQYKLTLANGVFVDSTLKLQEVFETTVIDNFDATVEAVDFRNGIPLAVNIINQFVEAKTRGKIQNIMEEQTFKEDSEIVLILVSALYFKADWARRFQRGCFPHMFSVTKDTQCEVMYMKQTACSFPLWFFEGTGRFRNSQTAV